MRIYRTARLGLRNIFIANRTSLHSFHRVKIALSDPVRYINILNRHICGIGDFGSSWMPKEQNYYVTSFWFIFSHKKLFFTSAIIPKKSKFDWTTYHRCVRSGLRFGCLVMTCTRVEFGSIEILLPPSYSMPVAYRCINYKKGYFIFECSPFHSYWSTGQTKQPRSLLWEMGSHYGCYVLFCTSGYTRIK